jgi:hypothetical protein
MESPEDMIVSGQSYKWNHNASNWIRNSLLPFDMELRGLTGDPIVEVWEQEGDVILAPNSLDMRVNGGGMGAVNIQKFGKKVQ